MQCGKKVGLPNVKYLGTQGSPYHLVTHIIVLAKSLLVYPNLFLTQSSSINYQQVLLAFPPEGIFWICLVLFIFIDSIQDQAPNTLA